MLELPKSLSITLNKVTLPILANEACWALGNITYTAIYARIVLALLHLFKYVLL